MKNKFVLFSMVVLSVFSTFSLAACKFDLYLNNGEIAEQNLEKLATSMQNKDRAAIKALFASNVVGKLENLENSIDELLTYFTGNYVKYSGAGLITGNDKHNDRVVKIQRMSNDVTTTENVYRLGIKWYVEDTGDAGNVGIWSFYILKFADDPNQEYSYWGDGYWTEGIHIGKIYIE